MFRHTFLVAYTRIYMLTTNSFSDIRNTSFRTSSDYRQGFALLMVLLHWLFCGKGWKVDLVMVSWTGMLLVPLFVIWVLRFFLIPDLLYVTCLLSSSWCFKLYVKTSNDVNITKTNLNIWFAALLHWENFRTLYSSYWWTASNYFSK